MEENNNTPETTENSSEENTLFNKEQIERGKIRLENIKKSNELLVQLLNYT